LKIYYKKLFLCAFARKIFAIFALNKYIHFVEFCQNNKVFGYNSIPQSRFNRDNQKKEEKYNFVIPEGSMPLSKQLMQATA